MPKKFREERVKILSIQLKCHKLNGNVNKIFTLPALLGKQGTKPMKVIETQESVGKYSCLHPYPQTSPTTNMQTVDRYKT